MQQYDCIVIGGGFYGCIISLFANQYFDKVLLLESSNTLLSRASLINQARVHNGYHYPRSLMSAFASFKNFPRFSEDFKSAIESNFSKFYAIAKIGSKVSQNQFFQTYKRMGAPIEKAPPHIKAIFNSNLIDEVFKVREFAFNALILREIIENKLKNSSVELRFNTTAKKVESSHKNIILQLENGELIESRFIFNASYAGLNTLLYNSNLPLLNLKQEITEMALILPPKELENLSFTIMDGAFFSIMPYPAQNLFTLSHVRYTPHAAWLDSNNFKNAYEILQKYPKNSKFKFMIKDCTRFLPIIQNAEYKKSIFEIKTILVKNEIDDGRPILFAKNYANINGFYNILGSKIDNIYEILSVLKDLKEIFNTRKRQIWSIFN